MKAIRLHTQGGPEQVIYEDAPNPQLLEGDALVRVLAVSTTRGELDWPPTYNDEKGKPRTPSIPGHEFCGIVESLTPGHNHLKIGEAVYALSSFFRDGAAAEYIAVHAADLAPKPSTLDAVQAAAVPLAGLTAWQAIFDHARLLPGQKILIHGAAGGVGTFAVQIAKWHGAHVIATASAKDTELLKNLGAHQIIDYKTEAFEEIVHDIDTVLDCVGGDTQDRSWQVLKRGGVLVSIAGESIEQPSPDLGVKGIFFIVKPSRSQLIEIGDLIDNGHIRIVIDAVLPLDQARQAFELALQSGKQGKVVLRVV